MKPVVVCMKWGTLYGPEYVNILARAVQHHSSYDHRFVCITDNNEGIIDSVETVPLPNLDLDQSYWKHGGWPKLSIFNGAWLNHTTSEVTPVLFLDLDTVICGNIDEMFEIIASDTSGGVTMIKEWKRFVDYINPMRPQKAMSSIFGFQFGTERQIWSQFSRDPNGERKKYRIEQYFLADQASQVRFWKHDWIISFKRHLLSPAFGVRDGSSIKQPPHGTKMVAFHGEPRPIDVASESGKIWGKRFRYGRGSVPFMKKYWDQFSN